MVWTRELLYCINLGQKKQHLIFPLCMYTPGRAESVWHLGTVMGFLCAGFFFFFWREWLGMAHHPLPACGPGQIFRSSSGKHSPHRGESMTTAGEENAQPYWMGVRERKRKKREREKNCLSAKMGDKGSSGFCTGTCPEAFLWSFNLLWHASLFHRGQKEDCVAT